MKINFKHPVALIVILAAGLLAGIIINSGRTPSDSARVVVDVRHPLSLAFSSEVETCKAVETAVASGDIPALENDLAYEFADLLDGTIVANGYSSFGTFVAEEVGGIGFLGDEYRGAPSGGSGSSGAANPSVSEPSLLEQEVDSYLGDLEREREEAARKQASEEAQKQDDAKKLKEEIEKYLEETPPVNPESGLPVKPSPPAPDDGGGADDGGGGLLSTIEGVLKTIFKALTGGVQCSDDVTVGVNISRGGGENPAKPGEPNPIPKGITQVGVTITIGGDKEK